MRVVAAQALLAGSSELERAIIAVEAGRITAISDGSPPQAADLTIPDDCVLLPALIESVNSGRLLNVSSHVHLNEPGRTAWEGFETGTLAAVSGGVTTLVDMPLNSLPPTTTVENLRVKQAAARKVGPYTDLAFWGGIIPGNQDELVPLLEAGVKGFKCFLIDSGVQEFPRIDEDGLVLACNALTGTNALILFHAELEDDHHIQGEGSLYSTFLDSRPDSLETNALALILRLARRYPSLRFHIVHLSTALAIPAIQAARRDGVKNLTVETCFHYLTLNAEEIPDNGTEYKCCPPIRTAHNRQRLGEALLDGTIDYVVSDHSPCVPELKRGDFMTAWGGVSGLGLGLSLMWTEFGDQAGIGRISEWLGSRQAKQLGLERGGELCVGAEASFVVFQPDAEFTVTTVSPPCCQAENEDELRFKNKISPYLQRTLRGRVLQTYIRGELVWDNARGAIARRGRLC